MFETTVKLDRDTLKEISDNMTAKWKKYFLLGIGILCFIFVFVAMKSNDIFGVIMCAAIAAIVGYSMILKPLKWGNNQYMAIANSGKEFFEYKTSFDAHGAIIENTSTNWKGDIRYHRFNRIVASPNYYVLFTPDGKYIIISRKELGEEQSAEFIEFLKTKYTTIKWKRAGL